MSITGDLLDPTDTYASDGGRLVECNGARVLDLYPMADVERTRDAIQVDIRTSHEPERGVTILVTADVYELRLPTTVWTAGAYGPAASTRCLKRVRADRMTDEAIGNLLKAAIGRRAAEFVPCRYCSQPTPPEHRHGRACHACAERHLGIVH